MGSCCTKEAPPKPKPVQPGLHKNPNKVQGGSRVYIRAQDPSVKLALKIIHLPQEIWSPSVNEDSTQVQKTVIRNDSMVIPSNLDNGRLPNPESELEEGQVAYIPQSFTADPTPEPGLSPGLPTPGQSTHSVDTRQISQYKLGSGPRTDDITVELQNMNISHVPPTEGNDYLYNPDTHPAEFDAINTLAISQLLLNLARRCLWENGEMDPPTWQWGKEPITVFPYVAKVYSAQYMANIDGKSPGRIEYGYFKQGKETLFFCRSFDVIAHETGHAILDGIKPKLMRENSVEGLALHESFGDLAAVFGVLDQVDIAETILLQTNGDLHNKNFLNIVGEGFGPRGVRNIDNRLKVSEVEGEPYSVSVVITGTIYDVIADTFAHKATRGDLSTDAQILSDIGRHLFGVTLMAYKKAPEIKIKIRDVLLGMISIEKDELIKSLMQKNFENRELLELDIHPLPRVRPNNNIAASCCDTLKHIYKIEEPPPPPNVSVVPVQP